MAAAMLVLLSAAWAAGEDWREPVRLEYVGSAACPDRAGFEARVLTRTARARFVTSDRDVRTFEVTLNAGPHPEGRLAVRRGGVVEGTRDVRADTCSDVADALALAAALAIDPALLVGPSSPAAPSASIAPAGPVASALPAPTVPSADVPGAPAPPPAPSPPRQVQVSRRASPAPSTRPAHPPHTLFVGAQLAAATGASPSTLVGVSPFLGWRSRRAGPIAPSVDLSFFHASSGTLPVSGGSASFVWNVGRVDACALSWPEGALRLVGCLSVEAGALQAGGYQIPSPQTPTRGWFAVGPLARCEWELLPPLFAWVQAAVMLHVTADRFFFKPDTTVYPVPLVGLEGSAGVGVHFL